ncbi:SpoIIE family protein phosphatase [Bernardetia sp. OM2101]|uniref:SpoIIE family protein phosphatase n=1 Tax=Bernardetia sp. OM2101 TaxID=3344876 RepID=UPI0035D016CB
MLFLFVTYFSLLQNGVAQSTQNQSNSTVFIPKLGVPLVRNFSQEEYGATSQNWAITQTPNGFIYVGNNGGVLEFDGVNWRRYRTSNKSTVKSLAANEKGEVFVGAKGELGVLKPDSTNTLHYVSLMDKIPEDKRNFTDVWQTFTHKENIYFRTTEFVFIFKNQELFRVIEPKNKFHTSFLVDGVFYIRDTEIGLVKLNESYELESVASEKIGDGNTYGIFSNLEGKGNLMVLTRPEGVYKIKGKEVSQVSFTSVTTLTETRAYCSVLLPTNQLAIGTLTDGLFITDLEGNVQLHLNKENILENNTIYNLFLDAKNNLWLATDNGISCIYLSIPYSSIGEKQGVLGRGLNLEYSSIYNKLYIGTTFGIYQNDYLIKINLENGIQKPFSMLEGTEGYALHVLNKNNVLFYGHNLGVFQVQDTIAKKVYSEKRSKATWGIVPTSKTDKLDSLKLLLVYSKGIALISKDEDGKDIPNAVHWKHKSYPNFEEGIRELLKHKNYWWAESNRKGVFRLQFSESYDSLLEIKTYGVEEGLPSLDDNSLYKLQDQIVLTNNDKIYNYDTKKSQFILNQELSSYFEGNVIRALQEDEKGNIWYRTEQEKGILWKENNTYKKQTDFMAALRIYSQPNGMTILPNNVLAVGVDEGFVIIDTQKKFLTEQKPLAFIRKVEFLGETDSLLFGGVFFDADSLIIEQQPKNQKLKLEATTNALRFSFASPSLPFPEMTEYRYKLEGLDEKWSAWTSKTQKEYTNLSDKNYKFIVQTRNIWGVESEETTYEFEVLSPWYKTWLAYVAYIILAILLIWMIVKLNTKRLERDKRKLEKTVQERTAEVVQQKEELQMQADNLSEANIAINNQKEELELQAENLSLANTAINEQKQEIEKSYQNVRILSQIGQKITNILDVKTLIQTVYENINTLMPADGFGIGILNKDTGKIEFEGFIENNEILPAHSDNLKDDTKLSVRSLKNNQRLVINDSHSQYKEYFNVVLEDVEVGKLPYSLVYLPLNSEGETIGVLTVQSMEEHKYSSLELDMLDTLGAYTAIALDNIKAYQIISNKNTNITDSIRYAQTIQQAVLPIEEEMKSYFEEHFVIFRPKDIVSGDFYWATETKDKYFVAVVDCTGHGVPGAFMSMLGHAFLNEAVSQQNLTNPADILEWLNEEIKISLRQEQKVNADGMDISLCVIDKNKSENEEVKITYCGAKRPLFYILPAISDLQVVKGNRRSIGGYSRKKKYSKFESNELLLPKGTMLYIFSDGYTDQSNPEGIKLGTPQLLEKLPILASLPITEQEKQLTDLLDNHQKDTPQRDDITFMGIKL